MITITTTIQDSSGAIATAAVTAAQSGATYPDGSAGAPVGTPQFPALLNAYGTNRPAWKVAGVDYAVGMPAGTVLADPAPGGTLAPALAALGGVLTTNRISFTGSKTNNAIISGYDFSLHGLSLQFLNCSNVTVENNNFIVGANTEAGAIQFQASTSNMTARNNVINGNNLGLVGWGLVSSNAAGLTEIMYNLIENAPAEAIVLGTTSSACVHDVAYNVIRDTLGNRSGFHGDWVQEVSSPGQVTTSTSYRFNTCIVDMTGTSTQGLSIFTANEKMGQCLAVVVDSNTMISAVKAYNQPNYDILINPSYVSGTVTITNNHLDITGSNSGWLFYGPDGSTGPYTPALTKTNNVNVVTGGTLV